MSNSTDLFDWIGTTVAERYVVEAVIGQGGMGLVYRARDTRLDSLVAIKIPLPEHLKDKKFRKRFEKETRALIELIHPRIVRIIDLGNYQDAPYVVLEYMDGGSLKDRVRRIRREHGTEASPQLLWDMRNWLPQVGKALDAIHGQQYLHRDIKPANILFDSNGEVKISDLGLAKALIGSGGDDTSHTQVGSWDYIAPEVVKDGHYSPKSDQYALAVTVYEIVSGRNPFTSEHWMNTLVRHTKEVPEPLIKSLPWIPPSVSSTIARGLEKKPEERLINCRDFAAGVVELPTAPHLKRPHDAAIPSAEKPKPKPSPKAEPSDHHPINAPRFVAPQSKPKTSNAASGKTERFQFQSTGRAHRPAMPFGAIFGVLPGNSLMIRTLSRLRNSKDGLPTRNIRWRRRERWHWWAGVVISVVVSWTMVVLLAFIHFETPEVREKIVVVKPPRKVSEEIEVLNEEKLELDVQVPGDASLQIGFADHPNGVEVKSVTKDGAADKARILIGDVILQFDNRIVRNSRDYYEVIRRYHSGQSVELVIRRQGRETRTAVVLASNMSVTQMALENAVETTTAVQVAANDVDAAAVQVELSDLGEKTAPKNDMMASVGSFSHNDIKDRTESYRKHAVKNFGGNNASEAAVARSLKWLANHQNMDGGWNFDHRSGNSCGQRCNYPGDFKNCRTGATALALLSFLGSGQTHKTGDYQRNVEAGLYFLRQQMKVQSAEMRGDLGQGEKSAYSHALATMALCEAYQITADKSLVAPSQLAINYIVYAQDQVGGGWRYTPRQPGDMSVTGWQLLALKNGHMTYLNVPKESISGTLRFLDSMQSDDGAKYGYTNPGSGQATTAIGLLCRMNLGWKRDNPALKRGVDYLSSIGPSKGNMYFNFFATQVMRHYEGEKWDRWNKEMRDYLVGSQDQTGHQAGSWYFIGDQGSGPGGRLYCTSMATLILEVYYRNMQIYPSRASEEDFPLR